jgi:hypothetical protein
MNSRILMLTIILTAIAFGTMVLAYTPPEYTDSSGDIKFAHAIHVAEQGIDCRSCHTKIDSSKLALDDNYPSMMKINAASAIVIPPSRHPTAKSSELSSLAIPRI